MAYGHIDPIYSRLKRKRVSFMTPNESTALIQTGADRNNEIGKSYTDMSQASSNLSQVAYNGAFSQTPFLTFNSINSFANLFIMFRKDEETFTSLIPLCFPPGIVSDSQTENSDFSFNPQTYLTYQIKHIIFYFTCFFSEQRYGYKNDNPANNDITVAPSLIAFNDPKCPLFQADPNDQPILWGNLHNQLTARVDLTKYTSMTFGFFPPLKDQYFESQFAKEYKGWFGAGHCLFGYGQHNSVSSFDYDGAFPSNYSDIIQTLLLKPSTDPKESFTELAEPLKLSANNLFRRTCQLLPSRYYFVNNNFSMYQSYNTSFIGNMSYPANTCGLWFTPPSLIGRYTDNTIGGNPKNSLGCFLNVNPSFAESQMSVEVYDENLVQCITKTDSNENKLPLLQFLNYTSPPEPPTASVANRYPYPSINSNGYSSIPYSDFRTDYVQYLIYNNGIENLTPIKTKIINLPLAFSILFFRLFVFS